MKYGRASNNHCYGLPALLLGSLLMLVADDVFAGRDIITLSLDGGSNTVVAPSATVTVDLQVLTFGPNNDDDWRSTEYTLDGVTVCENTQDFFGDGFYSDSFTITAPATAGSYDISFEAYRGPNCNQGGSSILTIPGGIVVTDTGTALYLDLFNVVSYNNNDGTENWAGPWVEDEEDGNDGPNFGDVNITFGELHLQDDDNSITRAVDLSAYTTATLSFDYREVGLDNANDWIEIQIRTNGGSWVTLQRFAGPTNTSGTFTQNIDTYISSNTELRFITSSSGGMSNGDDFYVDNFAINASGSGSQVCTANYIGDSLPSQAYNNNTGLFNWTGNWIENDAQGGGATGGRARVATYNGNWKLRLNGNNVNNNNNTYLYRQADLFGATAATLRFDFVADGGVDLGDEVLIEASSDGTNYTILENITGIQGNDITGSRTYNITPYISATTHIRFRIAPDPGGECCYGASSEFFYVDNIQIETCTSQSIDHYGVFPVSPSVTCEAGTVVIEPRDGGNNPVGADGETITLSTTPANDGWVLISGNGTFANGNEYTFAGGETSVTLGLQKVTPAIVDIDITSTSGATDVDGDPVEDQDLEFVDVGLRFYADGDADGTPDGAGNDLPNQISGAVYNQGILRAVRTDTLTGQCVAALGSQTLPVNLAYECNNPTSCIRNRDAQIAGVSIEENDNASVSDYQAVNLGFGAQGQAPFSFNYFDAGRITLHANMTIPATGDDPQITVAGSSNTFVVKPDDFVVTQIESTDATPINNPGTTSTGSGFIAAGTAFRVLVEARNAQGGLTPNYGNETSPPGGEGIELNFNSLIYPVGGVAGSLNAASVFTSTTTAGEFENVDISWNEVGTFTAFASVADGDYLGAGDVNGTVTGNVGRFFPARFILTNGTVTNSCAAGGFSYLSEPAVEISYDLEAQDLGGNQVNNYDNVDLTYATGSIAYAAENNDDGTDMSSRLSNIDAIVWDDGIANFSDTNVSIDRDLDGVSGNTLIDGPFTQLQLGISVNDLDGANIANLNMRPDEADDPTNCVATSSCPYISLGNTLNARFGRLFTRDTHGPETAPLKAPFQTEYWSGNQFLLNTNDSCTTLPRTIIGFDSETIDINLDADVGASTTTGSFGNITLTDVIMVNGDAQLFFSAPNATGSFPLDVDLSGVVAIPWLRFDWNQNGDHDDDGQLPAAAISFGNYRGHDRIIYWQEQFR